MTEIFLSIIVPNYNYGRFLGEALESIFSQCDQPQRGDGGCITLPISGCDGCVEVIVCDAASSDESVEIIKKYSGKISWWCSEKDGGQSSAFNKGFSHAHGDWLTWLNADDFYLPNVFSRLYKFIKRHPKAQWVTGNMVAFDSKNRRIRSVNWGPHVQVPLLKGRHVYNIVFGPTSFFKMETYKQIGPVDEALHYAMDTDYWARMIMAGIRQSRFNKICWALRVHEESKTQGEQDLLVMKRRLDESIYIRDKTGYAFSKSALNIWYLIWGIWRIVDGSWLVRKLLKCRYEQRAIEDLR